LAVVTFVAYQPTWHAGFIWDDERYVSDNSALRSVDGLKGIWIRPGTTIQYYPLVFTSFWVEYHLWGLHPFGYHLVNILLHTLNALLLWRVLRRLEISGAWLAAAIFAIHPVQVESVAWITERKNVLSGLFYLLAALAYLRFRPLTDAKPAGAWDWRVYPLVIALFLAALLSKTVTCSLPAALLLLVWWKTGRVGKRDALALAPLFVLGAALGLVTVQMEKHAGAAGAEWTLSFVQRGLVAGRALWFYAGKLFWPQQLTFNYPRWEIDAGAPWQYLFSVAALAALIALWRLRTRIGRGPLVAVLFFAGTLVPALGFFDLYPFRYSYVADHFQYLACIGLISLAVSTGTAICKRAGPRGRNLGTVAIAIVLLILGVSTWRQARIYQDPETLWRDTLTKNPAAWMAHNNLGSVFDRLGRLPDAIGEYEEALRLKPDFAEAHYNLGIALVRLGRLPEAMGHWEQALRIKPDFAQVHYNLGVALARLGRLPEAAGIWEQALRVKPDYAEAENSLAWLLATIAPADGGDPVRAVTLSEQACKLTDNRVAGYLDTLAVAYAAAGRFNEAITTAQKAIELAGTAGQHQLVREIEARLKSYRAGQAWREPTASGGD
jgi:tetratricopeptide (TPR) repeat protein